MDGNRESVCKQGVKWKTVTRRQRVRSSAKHKNMRGHISGVNCALESARTPVVRTSHPAGCHHPFAAPRKAQLEVGGLGTGWVGFCPARATSNVVLASAIPCARVCTRSFFFYLSLRRIHFGSIEVYVCVCACAGQVVCVCLPPQRGLNCPVPGHLRRPVVCQPQQLLRAVRCAAPVAATAAVCARCVGQQPVPSRSVNATLSS